MNIKKEFEFESPKRVSVDKLCIMRAKSHSFVCSNIEESRTKLKGIKEVARDETDFKDCYNRTMEQREDKKYVENYFFKIES